MGINKYAWFDLIDYKPHPRQLEYHRSKARFRAAVAGRRFGKSLMSAKDREPEFLDKGKIFWIIGPTYDLGEKEFRVIWEDMIIKRQLGDLKGVRKAYNKQQGNMYIEFPWQTRIEVRTADRPENLVGESLNGAIFSEAAKHKKETWERYIRPALADKRGWADFPTTPEGMNWIYDLYEMGQNPDIEYKDFASWRFPSWENSAIYPGGEQDPEIILLKNTSGTAEFDQEIAAKFTSFVGKVYPEFNRETHVRDFGFNPNWENYMAFDFGYNNPLACIEIQIDPMDNVYIWREHYQRGMIIDDHIAMMNAREQPEGYHVLWATGDAADPTSADEISQKLVPCHALGEAKQDWRQGIDLVASFIKLRPTGREIDRFGTPAEDEPKLYVSSRCPHTIREFNNYKSKPGTPARSAQEIALGVDDHIMDALRYFLVTKFILGAGGQLSDTMSDLTKGTSYNKEADLHLGRANEEVEIASIGAGLWTPDQGNETFFDINRMDF